MLLDGKFESSLIFNYYVNNTPVNTKLSKKAYMIKYIYDKVKYMIKFVLFQ